MDDNLYNPIANRHLETGKGKEELQKEIDRIKSISNEDFSLTENDYIDLARLSIASRTDLKEQTYKMLSRKLQITEMIIACASALINSSGLTYSIKGNPSSTKNIDNQELINDIYSTALMHFREECKYEIEIALHSMGRLKLFPQKCTSSNGIHQNITPTKMFSIEEHSAFFALEPFKKPTKPAIKVLERIKEYIEKEKKYSKFTRSPLAILAPIIYRIIAKENAINISTKLCVFIYNIIAQMGHIKEEEQIERNNREKRDYLQRYIKAERKNIITEKNA